MKPILVVIYAVLLAPSLLLAAFVWERIAVDRLFYCSDSVGIPGDFIPPFVHDATREKPSDREYLLAARLAGGPVKDYYFIAPSLVYLVWVLHLIVAVALPSFVFWVAGTMKNPD